MKRAIIYTSFYTEAIHPRVEMELSILNKNNIETTTRQNNKKPNPLFQIFNFLFLNIFKFHIIHEFKKDIKDYDIVIIYDLSLLPLSIFTNKKRQLVIYETLDFNIDLVWHSYKSKSKIIWFVTLPFKQLVVLFEKYISNKKVSKIIVNGYELANYFSTNNCIVNLYSSPFENIELDLNSHKKFAIIYLGLFTSDKGAIESIDLSAKLGIPLFIFGTVKEQFIANRIEKSPTVFCYKRMNSSDLEREIKKISEEYNLIGTSLIKSIHYSYSVQEANKDIDYLAMGIPIIGNKRLPTYEKIKANCGILAEDIGLINKLVNDTDFYLELSVNAKNYYNKYYRYSLFEATFEKIILE